MLPLRLKKKSRFITTRNALLQVVTGRRVLRTTVVHLLGCVVVSITVRYGLTLVVTIMTSSGNMTCTLKIVTRTF